MVRSFRRSAESLSRVDDENSVDTLRPPPPPPPFVCDLWFTGLLILDRDDKPEEIAKAEVYEETGYQVSISELVSYFIDIWFNPYLYYSEPTSLLIDFFISGSA
jgi:8-oxo-dGTP pyrophosphatase MutT (NUDIX family)